MRRAVLALLLAFVVVGCARSAVTPSAVPSDPVCASFAKLAVDFRTFQSLDPATTSVDQYRQLWATIKADYDALTSNTEALAETQRTELAAAVRSLDEGIANLPADVTASDAINSLQPEITALTTARRSIGVDVGCPID
jgi:tetrahydromethanopterin S-methyltransferase subunit B